MPIYRDIFDGPARNYSRDSRGRPVVTTKRYITIHNTSNDATAREEASYAKRRTDSTSSHYYVDSNSIVQSLDTDWRAWHVGSSQGNSRGISYEITGINGWSRAQWLRRVAWDKLAASIRRDCRVHNIAVRRLTVAQIKVGDLTGFITHNDARLAWGGTDHTDPGPNFPMDHLLALVAGDEEDDMPSADEVADKVLEKLVAYRFPRADRNGNASLFNSAEWARQHAGDVKQDVRTKVLPGQAAILAALAGDNADAITAKLDELAAEERQRDEQAFAELAERLDQAAAERAAVLAALQQHADGSLDAEAVVQRIGELLTTQTDGS